MAFRILWGIDAVVAAIFVGFFFIGLADGSVSSFNIVLWLGTLAALAAVLGGGVALRKAGHAKLATTLVAALAVPGALTGLFFLALIILNPRWN
jgi:hypothetical protein